MAFDDKSDIKSQLRDLEEGVRGSYPYEDCGEFTDDSLARHLRNAHSLGLTEIKPFRGKRVPCKGNSGKIKMLLESLLPNNWSHSYAAA